MSAEAPVENGNFNEGVSGSNIWHAPSIHVCEFTAKFTKRLVKNWRRYSSSKICKNESDRNHVIAESHGNDNNRSLCTCISSCR